MKDQDKEECCDWRTKDECPIHQAPIPERQKIVELTKLERERYAGHIEANDEAMKQISTRHIPVEGWEKAFMELGLEEYGQWKIDRHLAKEFIKNLLLSERQALVERVEGVQMVGKWKDDDVVLRDDIIKIIQEGAKLEER